MKKTFLPADIYLASLLGLSKEEYAWFKMQIDSQSDVKPGEITAGLETIATISGIFSLISIGLAVTASFFKPRQREGGGRVITSQVSGQNITQNQKFAPRSGFQGVQSPATLGTTIPLIYSNRAYYPATLGRPAGFYGGVRANLDLLWSQMLARGGDLYIKSIYMLGEGRIGDIQDLAIGDNTVGYYWQDDIAASQVGAKFTVYFNGVGGRIKAGNYKYGRAPAFDLGNSETRFGAPDVYHLYSTGNTQRPDFCFTATPSSDTSFGLSEWLPNGMFHRVNPAITATGSIERKSYNNGERFRVTWSDDFNAVATMWKQKYQWSYRCGVTSPSGDYEVNDIFEYVIYADSDDDTVISVDGGNSQGSDGADGPPAELSCSDIASVVAGYQSAIADSLIEGEVYKFGSVLAVLMESLPKNKTFISSANTNKKKPGGAGITEDTSQTMTYRFKVIRAGRIQNGGNEINPSWSGSNVRPPKWDYAGGANLSDLEDFEPPTKWKTVSDRAQGFKYTSANIKITRFCKCFEICIKSTVGIAVNGLFNFRGSYDYHRVNEMAGGRYIGNNYPSDQNIQTQIYGGGGVVTIPEERYSFFKIYIKLSPELEYVEIPASFAIRSNTGQPIHNYIRFESAVGGEPQLEFEPISSWEIRSGRASTPFIVIDFRYSGYNSIQFSVAGGITVYWSGTTISDDSSNFNINSIEPQDSSKGIGYSDDDEFMTDKYARVAEAFCYNAIETTIKNGPEHEIKNVNIITENMLAPDYRNLATIGFNAMSYRSWSQLSQVSVSVPKGRYVRRLLQQDTEGESNLFPDVFRDMLLSERFGMGDMFTEDQIEKDSFIKSAQWNLDRRYFFDSVQAEKVNLRQWGADVAATMLLDFFERDGRFALEPAIRFPEEGPVPISALFTAGNIVENSFSLEVLPEEERQPVQISVRWREERSRSGLSSPGVFPVEREVFVREATGSDSDLIEPVNIADYCTNEYHAIDCACYMIRVRSLITHTIKFSTTPEGIVSGLKAGDYIKVALDYDYYNEFANGIVLKDGTVVTTKPESLSVGSHPIAWWDGSENPVRSGTLVVDGSGKGTPTGIIFAVKSQTSRARTYKISSIELGEENVIDISAVHHPVDENGLSMIGKNWTTYQTDENWVIRRS